MNVLQYDELFSLYYTYDRLWRIVLANERLHESVFYIIFLHGPRPCYIVQASCKPHALLLHASIVLLCHVLLKVDNWHGDKLLLMEAICHWSADHYTAVHHHSNISRPRGYSSSVCYVQEYNYY